MTTAKIRDGAPPAMTGKRAKLAVTLAVLATSLLLAACGGSESGSGSSQSSSVPSSQTGYAPASQYVNVSPQVADDQSHPYIKGKLVVIWSKLNKGGGDPAKGELPGIGLPGTIDDAWDLQGPKAPSLHPTNPAQVGTIATLYCRPEATGRTYSNGMEAYDAGCSVTVLDIAANLIVGTKLFTFPAPDQISCPVGGPCSGGVGYYDPKRIAAYLESLPRRP